MTPLIPLSSYHNHCTFDDGRDSMTEMLAAARKSGFIALGYSSHSPLPYPAPWVLKREQLHQYANEVRILQQQSPDVEVYLGLELDYLGASYNVTNWHPNPPHFDFLIGSVHGFIIDQQLVSVDGPPDELRQLARSHGGIQELVKGYFEQINAMVKLGGIDFIGHFDLIKKNFGRVLTPGIEFEQQEWYQKIVFDSLDVVAASGVKVEVSTALVSRSKREELYPSAWLLPHLYQRRIPVVINSDAHSTKHLGVYHQQAAQLLQQAGYNSVEMLIDRCWQAIKFGSY